MSEQIEGYIFVTMMNHFVEGNENKAQDFYVPLHTKAGDLFSDMVTGVYRYDVNFTMITSKCFHNDRRSFGWDFRLCDGDCFAVHPRQPSEVELNNGDVSPRSLVSLMQ